MVRGALLTGMGQGAAALLQLLFIVVMARLLQPRDFGLMAMIYPLILFATLLQDGGLTSAVIQRDRIDAGELSTLFWVNLSIGAALAAILVAGAPLVAAFYGDPRLVPLTMASGGLIVLGALAVQHLALLNRKMHYGRMVAIDLTANVAGLVAAIGVALIHPSYWAIWVRAAATGGTTFLMAWLLSGWTPGRPAPLAKVRDLVGFGGNMLGFSLCNFAARNLDNILIGRVWGSVPLGLYDRGYRIASLPLLFVNAPLNRVVTPVLVRTRNEAARYRTVFLSTLQSALLVTVPLIAFAVASPERVILIVLGKHWLAAAPILTWLAAAVSLQLVTNPLGWLYVSQGRSREMMWVGAFNSALICAGFAVGLPWGPEGVARIYVVTTALVMPVLFWRATRRGPVRLADLLGALAPFAPAMLAAGVAVAMLDRSYAPAGVLGTALLLAAAYAVAFAILAAMPVGRAALLRLREAARGLQLVPARQEQMR